MITKIKVSILCIGICLIGFAPKSLAAETSTEPSFQATSSKHIANTNIKNTFTETAADNIGHALVLFTIFTALAFVRKH